MSQLSKETMLRIESLREKITPEFIDYCNLNGVNLHKWYRWQLHLIWQQRNDYRKLEKQRKGTVC